MDHSWFTDSGLHALSVHDNVDGSQSLYDNAHHFLGSVHHGADGSGHFTNAFGVMTDRFAHAGLGVQHFDAMHAPTFSEQSYGGHTNFLDGFARSMGSYDPMTSTFSSAMGALRLRLGT
jgi:hypothetical protein